MFEETLVLALSPFMMKEGTGGRVMNDDGANARDAGNLSGRRVNAGLST